MLIRSIGPKDFPAIHSIHRSSQETAWPASLLHAELELHHPYSSVIEIQPGKPLGYVLVRSLGPDREITSMAVTPAYQRQGLGAKLLDLVITQCRNQGDCTQLYLEVS